jgi:hypothetical protein
MTSRRFNRLFSGGLGLFLSQTALAIGIGDIAKQLLASIE